MADISRSTKLERYNSYLRKMNNSRLAAASSKLFYRATLLLALVFIVFFSLNYPPLWERNRFQQHHHNHRRHGRFLSDAGGSKWETVVRQSAKPTRRGGFSVLVTGAAGFVGCHASLALKKRGDGVLGLDNFNSYYDPSLKRSRQALLQKHGVAVVEADLNNAPLLAKLFDAVRFTHVLHLAAQAGVRYAMKNPQSYVASNIAGFVTLLEAAKSADPQPAIVWASSSSVYGLNTQTPFSELHRTDRPASLYAATKKAGEEIAHTYNHIYGLSITGLRFFTVYGPWGRPDMAYFSFTNAILHNKPITVFQTPDHKQVARDFTYIDDVIAGILGALDTAEKSTGVAGKKRAPAQLRVYNLGNTSPVPVGDLVSILESLLRTKAKRHVITMPCNGDVSYTHANVTLAAGDFGYRPTTDVATGLRKFVKWYVGYYGVRSRVKLETRHAGPAVDSS